MEKHADGLMRCKNGACFAAGRIPWCDGPMRFDVSMFRVTLPGVCWQVPIMIEPCPTHREEADSQSRSHFLHGDDQILLPVTPARVPTLAAAMNAMGPKETAGGN